MEKKREEREMGMFFDGVIEAMPVFAKELVAGGVAGGIAKSVVAPLERVKILFQTRREEFQSIGLFGSFKKIAKTEGVRGFYRWISESLSFCCGGCFLNCFVLNKFFCGIYLQREWG